MNAIVFWRIVWKEYRTQRAFWLSMAGITLAVELLVVWNYWHSTHDADRTRVLFAAGLGLATFYALGCGATLFAAERENGTYDFQRALPVTPLGVFAGKATFALASTAALLLLVWVLALGLARGLPDPLFHRQLWAVWGLAALELLAWGILFSLLLRRPLVAVILAVTCASVTVGLLSGETGQFLAMDVYLRAVPGRLLIAALLAVADVWLGARWFRERLLPTTRHRDEAPAETAAGAASDLACFGTTRTMLGRLIWQECRQSAAVTAALMIMPLPAVLFVCLDLFGLTPERLSPYGFVQIVPLFAVFAAFLSAPLLGASVFLADQTGHRYRFLAEHGIRPRLVWLSRHIRGSVVLQLGLLLVLLPPLLALSRIGKEPEKVTAMGYVVGYAVLAYACGQLCSMMFRSGILAAIFGIVMTWCLCGWAAMMYGLNLSWLWTVAPLPAAFLLATWLHAPDWILERKAWRARLGPALVVAVPMLAILVAIPPVRVYEIPVVEPGFSVDDVTGPVSEEEKQTLALYDRAVKLMWQGATGRPVGSGAADESARRKADEQAVALALEASRRPFFAVHYPSLASWQHDDPDIGAYYSLANLVLKSAEQLESEGKLDAAFDRCLAATRILVHARQRCGWPFHPSNEARIVNQLIRWAARPGQTSQRLLSANSALDRQWRELPTCCEVIKYQYVENLRLFQGREAETGLTTSKESSSDLIAYMRVFFWERTRALRLLNMLTAGELESCRAAEHRFAAGGALERPVSPRPRFPRDLTDYAVRERQWMTFVNVADEWLATETHYRATRLILALEAWKLDHGELPKSLEDLKGKYLEHVPVSPYTGRAFRYEPKGLPCHVEWRAPYSGDTKTTGPGTPFIGCDTWSARIQDMGPGSTPDAGERTDRGDAPGSRRTALWEGVWLFLIP